MTRRSRLLGSALASALSVVVAGSALAASTVPFNWTLGLWSTYDGRDMISNTGTFCEWYHSTNSTYSAPLNYTGSGELYTYISLWTYSGGSGIQVGTTVSFRNDGAQHVYCWRGFIAGQLYYFEFSKVKDTWPIYAAGNVQDH